MRRIEDEAARMGILVEDLLMLARLDEVAEAPHAAVDLAALAVDAVADARATAPDRDITLEWAGRRAVTIARGLSVLGDVPPAAPGARQPPAQRARAHAGRDADRGLRRRRRRRLPPRGSRPRAGAPVDDPDALFERFWRAEGGRERGKAGAGLGLAIVAAIVDAHGGEVAAANAPGGGAVLRCGCRRPRTIRPRATGPRSRPERRPRAAPRRAAGTHARRASGALGPARRRRPRAARPR